MAIDLSDPAKVIDLLNRAVNERGADYVYPYNVQHGESCYYFEDGQPSCIIGHILAYEGLTADDLDVQYDGYNNLNEQTIITLIEEDVIKVTQTSAALLKAVQNEQDGGVAWGTAVELAIQDAKQFAFERIN